MPKTIPAHEERRRVLTQKHKRPYGARVRVHLTDESSFGYPDRASILFEDGTVLTTEVTQIAPWLGGVAYELTLNGFASATAAEGAGRRLTTSVLWSCISLDVAVRLDYTTLFPARVFDRTQSRGMRSQAFGVAGWPTSRVVTELTEVHSALNDVSPNVALSMEIFAGAKMEVSERAKFVATVSALEPLAAPTALGDDVNQFVTEALDLLRGKDSIEKTVKESLRGRLRHLKTESIRQALLRVARQLLPGDTDAEQVIDRAYSLRSELVHAGHVTNQDLNLEEERIRVSRVIRRLYASELKLPLAKPLCG